MKLIINQQFNSILNEIKNVKSLFNSSHKSIHKARNELKVIKISNNNYVIKSFKIPHLLNQIIYSFFRDSKAKKSYNYSLKIGEFTPTPVAFVEFYQFGFLKNSYFISEEFQYDFTIREPLIDTDFQDRDKIFKSFAHFTLALHNADILHNDYSPGNILVKEVNNNFIFKIVDINRMEFRSLSIEERLKNFSKLWAKDEDIKTMIQEYAKEIQEDEQQCISMAIKFNQNHKNKINMKKRLKGVEVVD